jgi:glycosyltransferase involved in cell wall biosynthesis
LFLLLIISFYLYKNELEVMTVVSKVASKRGPRVGIVSSWARQGVPYQSRFLSTCLSKKYDVFIFGYKNFIKDEADWGYVNLVYTKVIQPWKVISWIKRENIKVIFFPDRLEDKKVLEWCRKNSVATVMIINYETIKKKDFEHYKLYTKLHCPVKCTQLLLKDHGFKNTKFIRWGIDNDIFSPALIDIKRPIRFIHNAGFGGTEWRKNTLAAVEAFDYICKKKKDVILILKSQRPIKEYPEKISRMIRDNGRIRVMDKEIGMNELIELYRSCQVSLLPSKWEGIGIPFIESLALGLPVLTVDAPPMNEWVRGGYNGLCAKVARWEGRRDRQFITKGAIVDVDDYAKLMIKCTDAKLLDKLRANAIKGMKNSKKVFTKEINKFVGSL